MSTHCRIALEMPGGSVQSIYCHHEGCPDGVGRVLLDHYQDRDKVLRLMALGDLSSLGSELEPMLVEKTIPGGTLVHLDPDSEWCRAYGTRDTIRANHDSVDDPQLREEEYLYLMKLDAKWYWVDPFEDDVGDDGFIEGSLKLLSFEDIQ